ncbi:MAG: hypothetical protein K2G88_10065 [Oscillospiraceae bacterium]|nr:hypothetical protein [Oscillospiraceae bacterium]
MFDLEPLNTGENSNLDECLPFEEDLSKALKNTHEKTIEELEKQWAKEDEEAKEKAEEYLEYIEDLKYSSIDFENDDEYSSGEAIPDCNPWRE